MDICQWKITPPGGDFKLGMVADRCGEDASIRIIRPDRKTDLDLCEEHFNKFIELWGLNGHKVMLLNIWGAGA